MPVTGTFLPYYLPFKDESGRTIDAVSQARTLLTDARRLVDVGAMGVAITYSANYGQTVRINEVYGSGGWRTGVTGSNQASVMTAMETLLGKDYSDLQGRMRIAPVSTMTYEADGYGARTHEEVIEHDLANIRSLLDEGWTVLGWQNNSTGKDAFAIGGGVSERPGPDGKAQFPRPLSALVQDRLKQSAEDYPGS